MATPPLREMLCAVSYLALMIQDMHSAISSISPSHFMESLQRLYQSSPEEPLKNPCISSRERCTLHEHCIQHCVLQVFWKKRAYHGFCSRVVSLVSLSEKTCNQRAASFRFLNIKIQPL